MVVNRLFAVATLSLCMATMAHAGPVTPDCSADKAAKHAAEKSTVGASTNRCSPSKTAKQGAQNVAGVDQKGPVEKHAKKQEPTGEKAKEAIQR
jgi:hypothetical protein